MATHISKTAAWNDLDYYKYKITLDADFDIVSVVGTTATISIQGTYTVYQTEHEQQMVSVPASDFGFLFYGEVIPAAPTTVIPGTHYMESLPTLFGGSAEQYMSKLMLEFRGDTYRADGGNYTSVWTVHDGLIVDRKFGNTTTVIPVNETIQVDVSEGGRSPVLSWSSTYVTFNPTTYHWGDSVAWVSFVDLDYRPGAILDTNWKSHNRVAGKCHMITNPTGPVFTEMRTVGAPTALGNPPSIYHDNKWYNGAKIGLGG